MKYSVLIAALAVMGFSCNPFSDGPSPVPTVKEECRSLDPYRPEITQYAVVCGVEEFPEERVAILEDDILKRLVPCLEAAEIEIDVHRLARFRWYTAHVMFVMPLRPSLALGYTDYNAGAVYLRSFLPRPHSSREVAFHEAIHLLTGRGGHHGLPWRCTRV